MKKFYLSLLTVICFFASSGASTLKHREILKNHQVLQKLKTKTEQWS